MQTESFGAVLTRPCPSPVIDPSIQEEAVQSMLALIRKHHPLSCASSFGKDSTTTTFLFLEAVRRGVEEGVKTTHYITTSCTGDKSKYGKARVGGARRNPDALRKTRSAR